MIKNNLKKIIIILVIIIIGALFLTGDDVKDEDIMINDNNSPVASKAEVKKFLDDFVSALNNHDKNKFLALFSKTAAIEDPVGIEPFKCDDEQGNKAVDVFYESNIAQSDVGFNSKEDIICGMDVIRDAVVTISPEPDVKISIDAYSFYQLTKEEGKIKMDYLRAFWEIDQMQDQVLDMGFKGIMTMMNITKINFENQGLSGVMGFMKGMSGIKDDGKESVADFVEAVNSKDTDKLLSLFKTKDSTIKYLGNGKKYNPESYMKGPGKDTKITVSALRSAGWFTACRFKLNEGGSKKHGVAIFQFSPEDEKLTDVRFYWN